MVRKQQSNRPGWICVTFELPDSLWANQVYVAGDFVDTPRQKMPMRQDRDGSWRLTMDLPAGNRYKYRYQIDQQWYTEWDSESTFGRGIDPHYSILNLDN